MSFENVCAHGQIHKEGCKLRLRPGFREGPLHSELNFTPYHERERGEEKGEGEGERKYPSAHFVSPVFPPFLSVYSPSALPVAAMCVRVSCQGSDPRTNILALFEERELLGLHAARVVPVTHTNADRSILRRVLATILRADVTTPFRFVSSRSPGNDARIARVLIEEGRSSAPSRDP